jgi:class 3 adenylate cyclase/pimeloyl-ACP methyl ester carboxylesterase
MAPLFQRGVMGTVSALPPVRYVHIGDESIAFRDHGGAGVPLLYLGFNGSHQDLIWDEPGYAHFLRSLCALGRLVTFDRRGVGLSSRTVKPTIEVRVADVERILDAVGIERAVLVAAAGSTETAIAFSAMRPDRTLGLVLYAAVARMSAAPDYPIGSPDQLMRRQIDATMSVWGTGITARLYAPSLADDGTFVDWAARYERSMATPIEARLMVEMYEETDVRDVLPLVRAPALVMTPALTGDLADLTRYVAANISGARNVEVPSKDHWPIGEGMTPFMEATAAFLADIAGYEPSGPSSRRLAAVLFTDLVGSTELQRTFGDTQWDTTLDSHDDLTRRAVSRGEGRIVKSTGDGILAVFDGPASAVNAALEIVRSLQRIGLTVRAGVHVGEVVKRGDDVFGIAVTLCSRIADQAGPNEVLVSNTVRDLTAGSGLRFEPRGPHSLKGIEDPVLLLAARDP